MTADSETLVAGETLVDFVPAGTGPPGEAGGYAPRFGGAPANVAVALARFDRPPRFWTRLAADDFGAFLRRRLEDAGIPDDHVVTDDGARTTLALVSHDETGDRSFTFYRDGGADARMEAGELDDDALAGVEWVHTGGVTLSVEPSRTATLALQARASERATVSLDPNWRPELWASRHEYRAVVRGALDDVDVIAASPEDLAAAGFDATDPAATARAVADRGPHTVVVTLGGDGAVSYGTAESPIPGTASHGGYDADVVDATGAGDAFVAGLIAALTHGVDDGERALAIADAAGAAATTRAGAVTALTGVSAMERYCGSVPWADDG